MALSLDELAQNYKAGTLTDADLQESGYMIHQVESLAEMQKNSTRNAEVIAITSILTNIGVTSTPSASNAGILGNGGTVTLTQPATIYQDS